MVPPHLPGDGKLVSCQLVSANVGTPNTELAITAHGQKLALVEKFVYQRNTFSKSTDVSGFCLFSHL